MLIVEDNFLAALHLQEMLQDMGAAVVGPVASVEEAEALARSQALDAAILDVSIRGGDCLSIARILRDRDCPFVFATGYRDLGTAREWGDVPILSKPIDERHLRSALVTLLSQSKPQDSTT